MMGIADLPGASLLKSTYEKIITRGSVEEDLDKMGEKQKHWTKVSSPATTVAEVASRVEVPRSLMEGLKVVKISSAGVQNSRVLTISQDRMALFITHQKIKAVRNAVAVVAASLPIPMWTPSKGFNITSSQSLQDRYVRYIDIADLTGLQLGVIGTQSLESIKKQKSVSKIKNQIVTIWHDGNTRSVSFLIEDPVERASVCRTIENLIAAYNTAKTWVGNDALLLRYIWYDVDVDRNAAISLKEFTNICYRINFYLKDSGDRFKRFRKTYGIKQKELTYGQCMTLLQSSKPKLPAFTMFESVFGKDEKVDAFIFWDRFLKLQDPDATIEDSRIVLKGLNRILLDGKADKPEFEGCLTKQQFAAFLHSAWNDAYDPTAQDLNPASLNYPLSHYWINTSHNTYLTGDQLQSKSSVEAYARALQRGCKCLELDCWDGDKKRDRYIPVVYHGHTLTSKIKFEDIIMLINSYLESHPDSLPLILSLENHCSHPYQKEMASSMKAILGRKLYVPPPHKLQQSLPTPASLRGLVVIKGKRPRELDESKDGDDDDDGGGDDTSNGEVDPYDEALKDKKDKKTSKIVSELANLTLFHGTKFQAFEKSTLQLPSHMHSISETKITKIVSKQEQNGELWRHYNKDHMTRTYPAGTRIDSSNYNPILAWGLGCQLVALNFQTSDIPLIMNDGRFRQNGGCGYVLKPDSILRNVPTSSQTVTVRIVSGSCLPKPRGAKTGETIDPYVHVELHDIRNSKHGHPEFFTTSFSTSTEDNNGFCPIWDGAEKVFKVQCPSVAMLTFLLCDSAIVANERIAMAAMPVSCLRTGYRSVQLYDESNTRTGPFSCATLLVEINC